MNLMAAEKAQQDDSRDEDGEVAAHLN